MAKYKLVAANIAALKTKGIVTAGDEMTVTVAHRDPGQKNKRYTVTFHVVNEAVETDNRLAMACLEQMRAGAAIQVDGSHHTNDSTSPMFEKLADGDPMTSKTLHVDGEEALTNYEKKMVRAYLKAKHYEGNTQAAPVSWKKSDAAAHLTSAKAHFAS
jgi:hypothetical protein